MFTTPIIKGQVKFTNDFLSFQRYVTIINTSNNNSETTYSVVGGTTISFGTVISINSWDVDDPTTLEQNFVAAGGTTTMTNTPSGKESFEVDTYGSQSIQGNIQECVFLFTTDQMNQFIGTLTYETNLNAHFFYTGAQINNNKNNKINVSEVTEEKETEKEKEESISFENKNLTFNIRLSQIGAMAGINSKNSNRNEKKEDHKMNDNDNDVTVQSK